MTRNRFLFQFLCLLAGASLIVPAARANPGGATITYRRVFKNSTPEFIEVKISDQGKAVFDIRQLDEDADPEPFDVGPAVRKRIFDLAAELKYFAIANLDIQKKLPTSARKHSATRMARKRTRPLSITRSIPRLLSSCKSLRDSRDSSKILSYSSDKPSLTASGSTTP